MDIQLKLFYIPFFIAMISVLSLTTLSGCTPTVQVTASEKPIEVNLNVKIEHEIRIKVDKEIDELFNDDDVF
ncbi:YnbE family lipoprotein [Photobacterium sp. BZF1]|uniref:YnbE family lipoprotein n=1 Tax=Photobacterium rosenbergii TaxID=294936 RepID=A0A2T3NKC7_9GAMM|nr:MULTISPECIES: YnbE family lipoprotein [Photobacterium]MBC7004321.1 YnbE family lipoprotein [Photobacterium sp. BZF1]MBY5946529.1 YnbE family lipoprotein [Photobacterium rosenbergii]PSW15971.1 YnbE family lipoprotein [Photobacterium rosenbergii]